MKHLIALFLFVCTCLGQVAYALDWRFTTWNVTPSAPARYLVTTTPSYVLFIFTKDPRFKDISDFNDLEAYRAKMGSGLVFAWRMPTYPGSHHDFLTKSQAELDVLVHQYPTHNYIYDLATNSPEEISLSKIIDTNGSPNGHKAWAKLVTPVAQFRPLIVPMMAFGGKYILVNYLAALPGYIGTKHFELILTGPPPRKKVDLLKSVEKMMVDSARTAIANPNYSFYDTPTALLPTLYVRPVDLQASSLVLEATITEKDYEPKFSHKRSITVEIDAAQEAAISFTP